MALGAVGIGKMGGSLALQAAEKGIRVVGTTRAPVSEEQARSGVEVLPAIAEERRIGRVIWGPCGGSGAPVPPAERG